MKILLCGDINSGKSTLIQKLVSDIGKAPRGYITVRIQKAVYSRKMNEPVFAHTTKREPEIAIENNAELFDRLIKKFESAE